jgi:hypothetical protein
MQFLRRLLWILRLGIAAVLAVRAILFAVFLPFMFWRLFRDSGYPWWIQVPAAVTLAILFWMLAKRYRRGRFDGPF